MSRMRVRWFFSCTNTRRDTLISACAPHLWASPLYPERSGLHLTKQPPTATFPSSCEMQGTRFCTESTLVTPKVSRDTTRGERATLDIFAGGEHFQPCLVVRSLQSSSVPERAEGFRPHLRRGTMCHVAQGSGCHLPNGVIAVLGLLRQQKEGWCQQVLILDGRVTHKLKETIASMRSSPVTAKSPGLPHTSHPCQSRIPQNTARKSLSTWCSPVGRGHACLLRARALIKTGA